MPSQSWNHWEEAALEATPGPVIMPLLFLLWSLWVALEEKSSWFLWSDKMGNLLKTAIIYLALHLLSGITLSIFYALFPLIFGTIPWAKLYFIAIRENYSNGETKSWRSTLPKVTRLTSGKVFLYYDLGHEWHGAS